MVLGGRGGPDLHKTGGRSKAFQRHGDTIRSERQSFRDQLPTFVRRQAFTHLIRLRVERHSCPKGQSGRIVDEHAQFAGVAWTELRQCDYQSRRDLNHVSRLA